MNLGTLMLIIAGIAIVLATVMKLALLDAWFWYGFFLTLGVVCVFMGFVAGQTWLLSRVFRSVEERFRPELRRGGTFATCLTILLYIVIPATVAVIAGLGTFIVVQVAHFLLQGDIPSSNN